MKLRHFLPVILLITILAVAGCTPGATTDGNTLPAEESTVPATPGGALPTVDDTVLATPEGQSPTDGGKVLATPGGSADEEEATRPGNADDLEQPPMPPSKPPVGGEIIVGEAMVSNIDIAILESFPVQIMVGVEGDLPDGCTNISHAEQSINGDTITVRLYTARPAELQCTMALVPYAHNISLDVVGLPAGDYTVDVNGTIGTFNLAVDNIIQ